ncbi:MAG: Verru_Chthon cassette protein B [Verrucomicrobiota bacterium]
MKLLRPSFRQKIARRLRSGFSLVEVTLATGITAIAITSVLGLVPQGLSNVREAGNLNAQSHITRHLLGSLSQSPWQSNAGQDVLAQRFNNKRFFFDDQGIEIPAAEAGSSGWVAYVAQVKVPPQDVVLPSSGTASSSQPAAVNDPYLRRVTVKVASVGDPEFDFENGPRLAIRSHTTLIARAGR